MFEKDAFSTQIRKEGPYLSVKMLHVALFSFPCKSTWVLLNFENLNQIAKNIRFGGF